MAWNNINANTTISPKLKAMRDSYPEKKYGLSQAEIERMKFIRHLIQIGKIHDN